MGSRIIRNDISLVSMLSAKIYISVITHCHFIGQCTCEFIEFAQWFVAGTQLYLCCQ